VGVAADRILGDAERRAEHARLGQMVRGGRREGERRSSPAAPICADQRREPCEVGFRCLEGLGPRTPISSRVPPRTHDTQRYAGVEALGGERQRIEHRESLAVVELAAHGRGVAANRDAAIRIGARTSMSTIPALDFCCCRRGASCRRDNTYCAATVAWPTNPASLRGVKKRARTV